MNGNWSGYIIALVVLNVVGCVILLWKTSRTSPGDPPAEQTGHVWDGDLTEYNKPLPRWWINLFYLTIIFTIGYLVWFPGLGNLAGTANWSSQSQHAADKAASDAKLAAALAPYDGKPIDELARDPRALAVGKSVFASRCANCHGSAGQGAIGFPNLTDEIWHWASDPDGVTETVMHGRNAVMPAWADTLTGMGGATAVDDVIAYVQSLGGIPGATPDPAAVARAAPLYAGICAACHGPAGKGNPLLGAPDLTDTYWLYGNTPEVLREGLAKGRGGVMPAHAPLIGETRARLAAAYAWSLSKQHQSP